MQYTDYQQHVFEAAKQADTAWRFCLYYKTGAGKTVTALGALNALGYREALVIAPPSTHDSWLKTARAMNIVITCVSHAKFRMKDFRVSKTVPIVADEFHMLGGHTGKGWMKLEQISHSLDAPMALLSATPNYNDAERVYCVERILNRAGTHGGFLQFIYDKCFTERSYHSMIPEVTGFRAFPGDPDGAAKYLASLDNVFYVPDDQNYTIVDLPLPVQLSPELEKYGLNERKNRLIASTMELKHTIVDLALVQDDGFLNEDAFKLLVDARLLKEPTLVYAEHSSVALALSRTLRFHGIGHALVTGAFSTKLKLQELQRFRDGTVDILVGTSSLATGTDGLDKICHNLIILDDTQDNSLRRQIIGRILHRGVNSSPQISKSISRVTPF